LEESRKVTTAMPWPKSYVKSYLSSLERWCSSCPKYARCHCYDYPIQLKEFDARFKLRYLNLFESLMEAHMKHCAPWSINIIFRSMLLIVYHIASGSCHIDVDFGCNVVASFYWIMLHLHLSLFMFSLNMLVTLVTPPSSIPMVNSMFNHIVPEFVLV
jgi:hypothetical protein